MSPEYVVKLGQQTLTLVIYVSGPMLIVALIVGLGISIFQAVTQIHEMTLTFIPKILAVFFSLIIFFPWLLELIVGFTSKILINFPEYIQ